MISLADDDTISTAFRKAADAYGNLPFLAAPVNSQRSYHPDGWEITFGEAQASTDALSAIYRSAGYGVGHRVGLFLDSRPEYFLHKLALNSLGVCCVPFNPDYRPQELAYLIDHARLDLIVVLQNRRSLLDEGLERASNRPQIAEFERLEETLLSAKRTADEAAIDPGTPASILYTSGTTGQPKGCVLSHRYELAVGAWYATHGHMATIRTGQERLYNTLPVFHVNAGVLSFWSMLLTGGCQVQGERFQPSRWWTEIVESNATIVHYLGVIVPMLLNQPVNDLERAHQVRFGIGAGVEPQLHFIFEERFGFPLLEIWGMTEIVRFLVDNEAPRQVGSRAFGRPRPGLDVKVAGYDGDEVLQGDVGELLVRHSALDPRKDFFSGYFDDDAATEAAWEGGWFHTGDIVTRDETGMLHFVDRRKNIIRRAGENIAAAEIEALLQTHPKVEQVAVIAAHDEVREEEVLACIVPKAPVDLEFLDKAQKAELARELFDFCSDQLAYYKSPGWILFRKEIPTTGTQKIQKHRILNKGADPSADPEAIDLRSLKKRRK